MHYDKTIRYLEYWENGERIRSAGFVKIEVSEEFCNIWVNVTGLHTLESYGREVLLRTVMAEKEGILGTICLQEGKGSLQKKHLALNNLCDGIGYYDLATIRIKLGKEQELRCCLREEAKGNPDVSEESEHPPVKPDADKEESVSIPEPISQMPIAETTVAEVPAIETYAVEKPVQQPVTTLLTPAISPILHEKKWKQLSLIYPHIAPFHDQRDYLSIGPGDFVVLPERYYGLVNNSFLIHGFYNYGHLVLTRTMKRGEETFYIGVPGNFYEKERQAAIMFGFESFECRREPAQEGDFGYFMIRVEL